MMHLAIDPGMKRSGWSLWRGRTLLDSGCVAATRLHLLIERIGECLILLDYKHDINGYRRGVPMASMVIERAPAMSRSSNPSDAFGPGVAAGLWIAIFTAQTDARVKQNWVMAGEWQLALLGPKRKRPYGDKRDAALVAAGVLAQVDREYSSDGDARDDEADAICLGKYWAVTR